MAQQFNDKEKKQFKKEIASVLDAIEDLRQKRAVRLDNDMNALCIDAKEIIKKMETRFDKSQLG